MISGEDGGREGRSPGGERRPQRRAGQDQGRTRQPGTQIKPVLYYVGSEVFL